MISSVYASVLALWIVLLSLRVIRLRRSKRIRLGDGGDPEMQAAIRAQGNSTEYVPIALILLFLLEFNSGNYLIIHMAGIALVTGRILHYKALKDNNLRLRVLGMQCTIFTIIALALLNLGYAVYRYMVYEHIINL